MDRYIDRCTIHLFLKWHTENFEKKNIEFFSFALFLELHYNLMHLALMYSRMSQIANKKIILPFRNRLGFLKYN